MKLTRLVSCLSLAWIVIAQQRHWSLWRKGVMALGALVPLAIAAVVLSVLLNRALAACGVS